MSNRQVAVNVVIPLVARTRIKRQIVMLLVELIVVYYLVAYSKEFTQTQSISWRKTLLVGFKGVTHAIQAVAPAGYEKVVGEMAGVMVATLHSHISRGKKLLNASHWNHHNAIVATSAYASMRFGGASFNKHVNAIEKYNNGYLARLTFSSNAEALRTACIGMIAWLIAAINAMAMGNAKNLVLGELKHRGFLRASKAIAICAPVAALLALPRN